MAYGNNTNTPYGFKPSQYFDGSTFSGQTGTYLILPAYATPLYTGDLVTQAANGTIERATAGTNAVLGVFAGCEYYDTNNVLQFSPYWAASTATYNNQYPTAFVYDDPNILFDVQASNTQNAAPSAATVSVQQVLGGTTNFFNNANFGLAGGGGLGITNPATGSTITGQSAMYLDVNSIGTGATQQLKIVRFTPVPGNGTGVDAVGSVPALYYNSVLVLLNNHVAKGGTGTAGI